MVITLVGAVVWYSGMVVLVLLMRACEFASERS